MLGYPSQKNFFKTQIPIYFANDDKMLYSCFTPAGASKNILNFENFRVIESIYKCFCDNYP